MEDGLFHLRNSAGYGLIVFIFSQVLSSGNALIAFEVTLSVQRLVKKYGKEQPASTWDIILEILETVLKQLDVSKEIRLIINMDLHS